MTRDAPLVSIIIPVYNCERYLAEALESVFAQTYRPIEVIVVDDGSTDNSANIAKHFAPDVHYCYQSNAGPGAARNRGIMLAQGTFLAFLDADDLWVKDKLALQMKVFDEQPEVDMVFGHAKQFYSSEVEDHIRQKIRIPAETIPGHTPCALLIRRETFFRVGIFENRIVGQVMSWYMRVVELGLHEVMLPDIVFMRRIHTHNLGITHRQLTHQRLHVLKAALDRRRKQGLL
ncbi:MAG: glycosyltransferase family 2 protein [bacterium]|nr:glycosyltransferase family 2 protein [bacterium]